MHLESRRPSGPLFRVGRDDDAWAVPDWAYAKEDGTFGHRFDDPMGANLNWSQPRGSPQATVPIFVPTLLQNRS